MGLFSCNAKSAIATCGSYESITNKSRKNVAAGEITEFDFSDLDAATDGFSRENLLGKGSHGSVYKARIRRLNLVAAVKRTRQNVVSDSAGAADTEVEILSKLRHPRLVNLLGYGVDPDGRKLIVVEYMPNGSLYELLHGPVKPPGWARRTRFAVQIACAVHFLHSANPPTIHRDIKSSNVLIDADFKCRVSDFGLALRGHVEDFKVRSTPPAGTLGYLDPGYLVPGDISPKSDVFSFGILMLEIISGRKAIDVGHSPASVVEWAVPAIKSGDFEAICDPRIGPPDDAESLRRMAVLAARCVRSTAEKRPGMAEAVECLKSVYKGFKQRSQACGSLRRCVGGVGEGSRAGKYGQLDDSSVDVAVKSNPKSNNSSRRSGRVSSAAPAPAGDGVGRSKSTGTAKLVAATEHNNWDELIKTRMRKSRSMGILRSNRSVNGNGAVTRTRTSASDSKLEESKLLGN